MDFSPYFKGKKITVMGLGLLGRGVGDASFLAECGADLIVTDLKTEEQLADSVEKLKGFSSIQLTLGEHKMEDFEGRDMILVAAGVPSDSPYLARASEAGARLVQSAALFAELSKIPMIGVTGTRGKSTVTAMVHHILETATGEKVIKGGNVRGVSNLQLLKEVTENSLAVFELDSWQLQGFGWAGISPQIAVFTSFMDDHLNYYRGDRKAYFKDKSYIYENQKKDDFFIVSSDVLKYIRASKQNFLPKGKIIVVKKLPKSFKLNLPGEHNRNNASFALEVARILKIKETVAKEAILNFKGVPY